jgi:hypothetical protein
MTRKYVLRAARLIGFVLSPLLTSPAAAAELGRGLPAANLQGDGPSALQVVDFPRHGADSRRGHHRPQR